MSEGNKKYIKLTLPQIIAISDKLREVCKTVSAGFVEYAPGWDDEKIASFLGTPITSKGVQSVRRKTLGKIYFVPSEQPANGRVSGKLYNRVSILEEEMRIVQAYLTGRHSNWRETVK